MFQPGALAYYAKTTASFKPLKAASNFKTTKDKVSLLWETVVHQVDRKKMVMGGAKKIPIPPIRLKSSPYGQS